MKKIIVFLMLAAAAFAATPSTDFDSKIVQATVHRPYDIVLNEVICSPDVDANDVALTPLTAYWDAINPDVGDFKRIPASYNYLEIAFVVDGSTDPNFVYDPNDAVEFDFKVWAARWYSSAVLVYQGAATTGGLSLSRDPDDRTGATKYDMTDPNMVKWVDTITAGTLGDCWEPAFCDVTTNTNTADGIARLSFDLVGHGCVWVEVNNITGNPYRIRAVASGL